MCPALKRRKAEQVARENVEGMDGHAINLFLRESKQVREERIVILCGKQREVAGCHALLREFRLEEPTSMCVLHVACGPSKERSKLFLGLWFNAQRKRCDGVHVHLFSCVSYGFLARCLVS